MKTFIPIECDIFDNNRMSALINDMGPVGYGIYMILLVEIRNREDYVVDSETLKVIARKYGIRRKMMEQVLYNYELFVVDRMPDDCVLVSSDYVSRVMRNYNEKVAKCSIAGKKSAEKRKAQTQRPLKSVATKEKNIKEKKTTTKEIKKVAVVDDVPFLGINSWRNYLEEALNDDSWLECQGMHSGLGTRFLQYQRHIIDLFAKHVTTHGKEYELNSVAEVKYYFANFIRQGTPTCKRIAEELEALCKNQEEENPYRFEFIDPETGQRTFQGIVIPADAPPRPNDNVTWVPSLKKWA
ncbi:Lin1244/Lin1753 domain-containing protein [Bacteroides sp. 224]|uniref:DUF7833 domain-containing protein n=1 Tax=Bacteroides sp. 224 TaxID=2302936 RepID=UPI0013D4A416|nr:Lin1244/Lin1753 domain-containing protein [Bacteroides sp. 224]NDV63689.1 DUF4373 domain-containing protein [Bacteroides sp. 224]